MRFLLVDRVDACGPDGSARGLKCVAMSEDYLEYHFPETPIMPGTLLLEALVQLAGWGEAAASGFERWFLMDRVVRCGFYGFVLPGDSVRLEVQPLGPQADRRRSYRGTGTVAGERKVVAEFEGELVPLAALEDPGVQRDVFLRLSRERSL